MNPIDDIFDELERFNIVKRYRRFIQPFVSGFIILAAAGFVVGGQ